MFSLTQKQIQNTKITNSTLKSSEIPTIPQDHDPQNEGNHITFLTPISTNTHILENIQIPSITTSIPNEAYKIPLSDSSSLKFPENLISSANISKKEKVIKKTKIHSHSNSSCKSDMDIDEESNPIENFFTNKDNLLILYLQFKYILDNLTNKSIDIHTLSENSNIDTPTLMDLLDEIRPIVNDQSL